MKAVDKPASTENPSPSVGLFVTCLVDLFRPNVGFAALDLLEQAGARVDVPQAQVCCGQPAFNTGDEKGTKAIAQGVIAAFEHFDYVVAPSGSCAGMIREHYPVLFAQDPKWSGRAEAVADKTWELISFLNDVMGVDDISASLDGNYTYHDSCSGLRELGISHQPRNLLSAVRGLSCSEMKDSNVCCGFGGTFCVKYPDISERMVNDKIRNAVDSGADYLLGGDMGCLMNIAGKLSRDKVDLQVYHVAEVLADRTDVSPIAGRTPEQRTRSEDS